MPNKNKTQNPHPVAEYYGNDPFNWSLNSLNSPTNLPTVDSVKKTPKGSPTGGTSKTSEGSPTEGPSRPSITKPANYGTIDPNKLPRYEVTKALPVVASREGGVQPAQPLTPAQGAGAGSGTGAAAAVSTVGRVLARLGTGARMVRDAMTTPSNQDPTKTRVVNRDELKKKPRPGSNMEALARGARKWYQGDRNKKDDDKKTK
jgi:hypothetical protein